MREGNRGSTNRRLELEKKWDKKSCLICGSPLGKGRRKYCSEECSLLLGEQFTWQWLRDGLVKEIHKCQKCGVTSDEYGLIQSEPPECLVVHHIKSISKGGPEFDKNNLIVLCRSCHKKEHSHLGNILRGGQTKLISKKGDLE